MHTKLLDSFIRSLACEKGLSPHTVSAYSRDISRFLSFIEGKGMQGKGDEPTVEHVVSFLATMKAEQYASSSMVRALIALKVFFRYGKREGVWSRDIAQFLDTPKLWQTLPEILSPEEVDRLLSQPDMSTKRGIRDKAILELLYATGIRVSELCGLDIYDVSDDEIRVFGKGSKERIVPVSERAVKAVDSYLIQVRGDVGQEKKLFLTMRGKPLDRIAVWKLIKQHAKEASLTKNIFPHMLRHSFASHLLDGGAELRIIQEMLGHASIASTDRYTHVSLTRVQESFVACHPRN